MPFFWEIIISNTLLVCFLAVGVSLLGRVWKNSAAIHLLWVLVLLKLFMPPIFIAKLPASFNVVEARLDSGLDLSTPHLAQSNSEQIPTSPAKGIVAPHTTALRGTTQFSSSLSAVRKARSALSWETLLGGVWAVGVLLIASRQGSRIHRFRSLLRETKNSSVALANKVAALSQQMGIAHAPEIRLVPHRLTPLVWAIGGRPILVLPTELFARLSPEALETVLIHELAHVRRKDHLVRILELAAMTFFWWHPVAWYASSRLRELEESCCDKTVLELAPKHVRTYATALVDTLEFLSGAVSPALPLATAIHSSGSLAKRITVLHQDTTHRLTLSSGLLIAVLATIPLAVAFAEKTVQNDSARITGIVTNDAGEPLADVLVRVAIPATDMRFVYPGSDHVTYESRTRKDGHYEVVLEGVGNATTASIDAMTPGYRRLSGALSSEWGTIERNISPGNFAEASFTLKPSLYVKGIVVNKDGDPLPNIRVAANSVEFKSIDGVERVASSGGIERSGTRKNGSFEIFNFPLQPQIREGRTERGLIFATDRNYVSNQVDDIYALSDHQRTNLRMVMLTGRRASGVVLDAGGQPVSDVMVEVLESKNKNRDKVAMTDSNGKFTFRGLVEQPTFFRVHAMKLRQKITLPVDLDRDYDDLELRLKPIEIEEEPITVEVLGMKLADITPELMERYDLPNSLGALVLDPGKYSDRFGIGELCEGNTFVLVGNYQPIGSVREFVEHLLGVTAMRMSDEDGCRVVYNFSNLIMHGTNTQYMKLTEDDVRRLREVLKQLPPK